MTGVALLAIGGVAVASSYATWRFHPRTVVRTVTGSPSAIDSTHACEDAASQVGQILDQLDTAWRTTTREANRASAAQAKASAWREGATDLVVLQVQAKTFSDVRALATVAGYVRQAIADYITAYEDFALASANGGRTRASEGVDALNTALALEGKARDDLNGLPCLG